MATEVNQEEKNTKNMKVFVAVPPLPDHRRRDPIALEVSRDDTVGTIKAKLHGMEGIPPRRQRLVFPSRSALPDDNDATLGDHGVVDSATIQLVETKMQVFVRCMHTGSIHMITLNGVESSDTVESFRLRLQEREDIQLRPAQQRIICGRYQLEDGYTLADYGVRDCTTMTLLFRPDSMRERVVELDIEVTDTVGRIKERVEEAEGVPVACQSVYFCGEELDDGRALANYGALERSTPVKIMCHRHEKCDATEPSNKGDVPMVVKTEPVKRRDDVEANGLGKEIEKRKSIKNKPFAKTEAAVQRRRFSVYLIGPELASICRSSCDMDPAP